MGEERAVGQDSHRDGCYLLDFSDEFSYGSVKSRLSRARKSDVVNALPGAKNIFDLGENLFPGDIFFSLYSFLGSRA